MQNKKPRISKQKTIELCKKYLWQGNGKREDIMAILAKKWQFSTRTFDRHWKQAQKEYLKEVKEIEKKKQINRAKVEEEAVRDDILTRIQRMKIASDIAMGKGRKIGGDLFIPTDSDRIRALSYLSKIEGDFAPKEIEHSGGLSITKSNYEDYEKYLNED